MQIILFNGPPRCGKDTASAFLEPTFEHLSFAWHLKEATHKALGLSEFPDWLDEHKDDPKVLPGPTLRQCYIQMSEYFFKPLFGKSYFGDIVSQWIEVSGNTFFSISDSGFVEEANALKTAFGADKLTLVRIHRKGCNFKGDSRGYITLDDVDVHDIFNDSTLEEFQNKIEGLAYDCVCAETNEG